MVCIFYIKYVYTSSFPFLENDCCKFRQQINRWRAQHPTCLYRYQGQQSMTTLQQSLDGVLSTYANQSSISLCSQSSNHSLQQSRWSVKTNFFRHTKLPPLSLRDSGAVVGRSRDCCPYWVDVSSDKLTQPTTHKPMRRIWRFDSKAVV